MDSILKPAACPTGRLIFRFKLIDDVGVCCRVRDLGGALRVKREEANFNDVGCSDSPRDESSLKGLMCPLLNFKFRRRTAAGGQVPEDRSKDAGPGSDKLRVVRQIQLFDDGRCDVLRLQHLNLTVDGGRVHRKVCGRRLLLRKRLSFLGVDQELSLRRESRRRYVEIDDAAKQAHAENQNENAEPPARKADERSN